MAVTIFSQIQVVLSCVLLAATIFWTCIKIAKALKDSPNVLSVIGCVGYWAGIKKYRQISLNRTRLRSTIARKTTTANCRAPSRVSGFVELFLLCLTD